MRTLQKRTVLLTLASATPLLMLTGLPLLGYSSPFAQAATPTQSFNCVEDSLPKPTNDEQDCIQYIASKHYDEKIKAHLATLDDETDDFNRCLGRAHYQDKVATIYEAANEYDLSPIVLTGAILQESTGADLGLGRDFDNWTCGPSQFSVLAWCSWAKVQSPFVQRAIGWPADLVNAFQAKNPGVDICEENRFLAREQAKPFLEVGMKRMAATIHSDQEFMLQPEFLVQPTSITYEEVADDFKNIAQSHRLIFAGDPKVDQLRFEITKSFSENCSNHKFAIRAMAHNLRQIYESLPVEIQRAQKLPGIAGSNPLYSRCRAQVQTTAYPLSVGWLISDAIYNAGPSLILGIKDYQATSNKSWDEFTPDDLLSAIHYAISPKFGMYGIGPEEAKSHISGVLNSVGAH